MHSCCIDNNKFNQLWQIIRELQGQITPYFTMASGFMMSIPQSVHKLNYVKGYLCLDPSNNSVQLQFNVTNIATVTITSNISLNNHRLFIF